MAKKTKVEVFKYLKIFNLDTTKHLDLEALNREYRKLAKIYHPDAMNSLYSDGKMFVEINNAYDYLKDNSLYVNSLIDRENNLVYIKAQEEAEKKRKEEELRQQELQRQALLKKQEELIKQQALQKEQELQRQAQLKKEQELQRQALLKKQEELKKQASLKKKQTTNNIQNDDNVSEYDSRVDEIKHDLQVYYKCINKDEYSENDYKTICVYIRDFIKGIKGYEEVEKLNAAYQQLMIQINEIPKNVVSKMSTKKKVQIIGIASSVVLVMFFILIFITFIKPSIDYKQALNYLNEENYERAYEKLNKINYKDSKSLAYVAYGLTLIENNQYERGYDYLNSHDCKCVYSYNALGGTINNGVCSKDGYDFIEWEYTSHSLSDNFEVTINLSAKYIGKFYNITYDLDGGEMTSNITSYQVAKNTVIESPEKTGYNFIGWWVAEVNVLVPELVLDENFYGNLTLTALYRPKQFTVILDANGGSVNVNSFKVDYGKTFDFEIPICKGYRFLGWYYDNQKVTESSFTYLTDVTFVARFEPCEYSITYVLDGGTCDGPTKFFADSDVVIPNASKPGYDFKGWKLNNTGEPQTSFTIKKGIYNNITLVAVFTETRYKITFDSDGGTSISEQDVFYNTTFSLPTPEKAGFEFLGWYLDNEQVIDGVYTYTRNINLKAKWKRL